MRFFEVSLCAGLAVGGCALSYDELPLGDLDGGDAASGPGTGGHSHTGATSATGPGGHAATSSGQTSSATSGGGGAGQTSASSGATGGAGGAGGSSTSTGGGGCVPSSGGDPLTWANWPMPNGAADVMNGAPNPTSYTDNQDGTVTDNVTCLVWQQQDVDATTYTQADALAHCANLGVGGFGDWRLPTRIELVSLLDLSVRSPAIDATAFPSTPLGLYWSASPSAQPTTDGWFVSFDSGYTDRDIATNAHLVRCVR